MSALSNRDRRHRRLVVERGFQYNFTLRFCLMASLVFLVFGGVLLYFIKHNFEILIQNALLTMPEMVGQMQREFRFVSLAIVTCLILMTGAMYTLGLLLTQRLAGPLFAFRRQLKDFAEGRRGVRLSLRAGDDFVSLAEVFNFAMEAWEQRQATRDSETRAALTAIASGKPEQAAEILQKQVR